MYKDNFEHVGGTTAICEGEDYVPPKSYKIISGHTGETCGSVFWVNINSRLMQLYPREEKYAAEVELAIYNTALACQDANGSIRYHNRLHGSKRAPKCEGTCCESAVVGIVAKLPEYIYSLDSDGLFVNLYAPSTITWDQGGGKVTMTQATSFPGRGGVNFDDWNTGIQDDEHPHRVPSWAAGTMEIDINGQHAATGRPGSYVSLRRKWSNEDVIRFTLPMGFTAVKYTGLDQAAGNVDRYSLLKGPILMALNDANGRIHADPATLPSLLTAVDGNPLQYNVKGTAYRFVPYWQVNGSFTCIPMVHP